MARGIIIPTITRDSWFSATGNPPAPQWQGAVIRRQAKNPSDPLPVRPDGKPGTRYLGIKGTTRSELYPFPTIEKSQLPAPGLIVEGEIDALTLQQEAGHLGIVATVGGASCRPSDFALEQIKQCSVLLVATDTDKRGRAAYDDWKERFPKQARRPILPFGKDVNAFHSAGGDVAEWIATELDRFGFR